MAEASPITTIIIDDEPLGREAVRGFLSLDERFEITAECQNGDEAIEHTRRLRPDVLFLDIKMPGKSGFDVLLELGDEAPVIVFVTAFDDYALRAFAHNALDYVLKPIDADRFEQTLGRVVDRVAERRAGGSEPGLASLIAEIRSTVGANDRMVFKTIDGVLYLDRDELQWVESRGKHLALYVGGQAHLMRTTMSAMEERLDAPPFCRTHRSFIVNVGYVREMRTAPGSADTIVLLRDGNEIPVSRAHREALVQVLNA